MKHFWQLRTWQVNKYKRFCEKNICAVPDDYIWIEDPVWSDIIGYDRAYDHLLSITGIPSSDSYYTTHLRAIRRHFRSGEIPFRHAKKMKTPAFEVMYSTEEDLENEDGDKKPAAMESEHISNDT